MDSIFFHPRFLDQISTRLPRALSSTRVPRQSLSQSCLVPTSPMDSSVFRLRFPKNQSTLLSRALSSTTSALRQSLSLNCFTPPTTANSNGCRLHFLYLQQLVPFRRNRWITSKTTTLSWTLVVSPGTALPTSFQTPGETRLLTRLRLDNTSARWTSFETDAV